MIKFIMSPLGILLSSLLALFLVSVLGLNGGSISIREAVSHIFRDWHLFGGYLLYSGLYLTLAVISVISKVQIELNLHRMTSTLIITIALFFQVAALFLVWYYLSGWSSKLSV